MKLSRLFYEFCASFTLGGMPFLYAYLSKGVEGATAFVKSIDTSDPTVYYFLALAGLHFIVSIIGYYSPRQFNFVKKLFHSGLYPFFNRVGDSLLCLYRILSGGMIGCAFIGVTYYPILGSLATSMLYFVLAFPFIWACAVFGGVYDYALRKQV